MASGVNKITLIGNLGRDPEVRYAQSGTPICNFSIGVTERRKEKDDWKDHTEWFNIVTFGKTAENTGRFLKKGRQVYIDGRLQSRKWQDKEGQQRTSVEVIANQIVFLGSRDQQGGDYTPAPAAAPQKPATPSHNEDFMSDDDIPF